MAVKKQFNSFEEMIEGSELPLLVDFYAPWCGPCQMMAKILDQVGAQLREQVQIVKLNTDNYGEIASQYQIHALPTLVLFKNGQPINRIEGVVQAEQLVQHLRSLI